ICWEYQITITHWAWEEFKAHSGTRKIAEKTQERLKKLIWLAAQAVKAELFGGEGYEYQELALLAGVTTKNWSKTFTGHWVVMKHIFHRLDSEALLFVMRTRSEQKAAFSKQSIAKVD
ncbi:bacteriophage antitermination protein Q, partial [Shigella flexneri]